jgi:hypothetical protein
MIPVGLLPQSQLPTNCPYLKPAQYSLYIILYILKIHPNIIFHLLLGLPIWLFPSGFLTKSLYTLLPSPFALHAPTISFCLLSPAQYSVSCTDHQAPHYVVCPLPCNSIPLSPKHSPQHAILKQPAPTFLLQCQ